MNLKQFNYSSGNLGYLLWSGTDAMAIDGGAVAEMLSFIYEKNLTLKIVTNTHNHSDHTPGNRQLLEKTAAEYRNAQDLTEKDTLILGSEKISVLATPGHTMDSIVFSFDDILITGDTLFNGTVGNCYTGEYELYFNSLQKLISRPKNSIIYAGHDLVDYAVGVIRQIDPDNPYLDEYVEGHSPGDVRTTLEQELQVNPFIRFNDHSLDAYRDRLNMPTDSEYQRWRAMMTVH